MHSEICVITYAAGKETIERTKARELTDAALQEAYERDSVATDKDADYSPRTSSPKILEGEANEKKKAKKHKPGKTKRAKVGVPWY